MDTAAVTLALVFEASHHLVDSIVQILSFLYAGYRGQFFACERVIQASAIFFSHQNCSAGRNVDTSDLSDRFSVLSNDSSVENVIVRSVRPHSNLQFFFFFGTFLEHYSSVSFHFLYEFIIAVFEYDDVVFSGAGSCVVVSLGLNDHFSNLVHRSLASYDGYAVTNANADSRSTGGVSCFNQSFTASSQDEVALLHQFLRSLQLNVFWFYGLY